MEPQLSVTAAHQRQGIATELARAAYTAVSPVDEVLGTDDLQELARRGR